MKCKRRETLPFLYRRGWGKGIGRERIGKLECHVGGGVRRVDAASICKEREESCRHDHVNKLI